MRKLRLLSLLLIVVLIMPFTPAAAQIADEPETAVVTETIAPATDGPTESTDGPKTSGRLIVELTSPPLAAWAENVTSAKTARGRLNVSSASAQTYMARLANEQAAFQKTLQAAMPEAEVSVYVNESGAKEAAAYKIAFNGMAVEVGDLNQEAARRTLEALPGVKHVYLDYAHTPDVYTSTTLINAPVLWEQLNGQANAGAGVKIASMDGGAHHEAAMFDGTGFSYPAGYPEGGLGLTENNNGKIIASRVYFRSWDPPADGEENPWPGTTGTSHGTHTASTAGGNVVTNATYGGIALPTMSGVAPGAWIMSYRVFYNSVTGDGSFYNTEGLAALEDIIADGADVLNNSWGGGPTGIGGEFDALDTALVNASKAGVFVSMSNGNAGPGLGSGDHPSDEYINVAATSTSGTYAAGMLSVIAPTPVSPTLQDMSFSDAEFGSGLEIGEIITYTYLASDNVNPANAEGCSPWPAGTFTGNAALILRGTCDFSQKVYYAQQGGAEFVVVRNHATGGEELINMGAGDDAAGVTISSVFVGYTNGTEMLSHQTTAAAASQDAVLELNTIAFQAGNTPDVVVGFSSRGPSAAMTLKPDVAAPGVNIMAQGYASGVTGEARHLGYGQASGTSMAAPHVTGSAALLRAIHPEWSNAYIKSALMSTAKYLEVYNSDGTPAQPLDMGAGRIDLAHAAAPGVILDPPNLSFGLVPTGTTKTIVVNLTSVAEGGQTYALSTLYTGDGFTSTTEMDGLSVTPASVTLLPGASAVITVTFDGTGLDAGDHQGFLVMDGSVHDAHMPAWARILPEPAEADVLIIDASLGGGLLYSDDYGPYYTDALDELGLTYDIWYNFGTDPTVPDPAVLMSYDLILVFTGDNYEPDGTYTISTPLTAQDMDALTEYANAGGKIIAMGQDLAAVTASNATDNGLFFYYGVLGGNWLQDSVADPEYLGLLPTLPIATHAEAPAAFEGIALDLSDVVTDSSAINQYYIDEISREPFTQDPDRPEELAPYVPLLAYPGPYNVEQGIVAMFHRDQPSLERPGISYLGRSIYATFGLEGVNDGLETTERAELLDYFVAALIDEPTATISNTTVDNASGLTRFKAHFLSSTDATPVGYRWDFGDGSDYTVSFPNADASHTYTYCGTYTVRVEVEDWWGNYVVGTEEVKVDNCLEGWVLYLPIALRD